MLSGARVEQLDIVREDTVLTSMQIRSYSAHHILPALAQFHPHNDREEGALMSLCLLHFQDLVAVYPVWFHIFSDPCLDSLFEVFGQSDVHHGG